MPGIPLNLDLPSLADPMATIVAKLVTALAAVQTDLAPKITPAQFSVNAPLSLLGNALTEVTTLQFSAGNTNITPGAMFYYNGEFYLVGADGTPVQVTANGVLNIGGTGGFNGDYVASNPTGASYDLASGQFRFTKSAGIWADMSIGSLVLNNATTGSVTLTADPALTTGRTMSVKGLPTSGVSGLVYNGSTSTVEDSAVTRETNTHLFTSINASAQVAAATVVASGDITGADHHHTAEWELQVPYFPHQAITNIVPPGPTPSNLIAHLKSNGPSWDWYGHPVQGLRVGDRLKKIVIKILANTSTTVVVNVFRQTAGSLSVATIDGWSVGPTGTGTYTHVFSSPLTVSAGQSFWFEILGNTGGEEISPISLFVDHP